MSYKHKEKIHLGSAAEDLALKVFVKPLDQRRMII
jgi:hypothetical protein